MNMNKIALTLLTGILTALSLVSCMDDELIKTGNVVEGKPVTVTMQLAFTQPSDIVVTRADDNTLSDLSNLIIIVYKQESTGTSFECMYSSNLTNENSNYKKLTFNKSETIEGGVLYSVSFAATSGKKKLIAIANTGADDQAGRIWDLTSLQGNSMSFDQLKEAVIKLQDRLYTTTDNVRPIQITSSSQMLMTGWNDDITFGESGNVTSGLDNNKVAVKLDRAMARIKFNIVAKPENAKGTFTPSSYRIYNIPVNSYLTKTGQDKTTPTVSDGTNFIHTSSANIGAVSGGNYSFSFYMPENIYGEIKKTNNNQEENLNYVDRDKWDSSGGNAGASPENKKWTYAPPKSTFVVINGTYSGSITDENTGQTTNYVGNVEYTVHLGDFSDTESMGNFSIERNCSYTYNMKVLGVDNIIVEVEKKDEEPQPGAEGEIYTNTSAYNFLLDAHYEQVYLEYNLSAIAENVKASLEDQTTPTAVEINQAIADNLILVIQSPMMKPKRVELRPYELAMKNSTNAETTKEKALENVDYKWIEFWPQAEADKIAKYPGVSTWSRANVNSLSLKNPNVYGEYTSDESCTEDSKKLLDVYDVIVAMGNVVKEIYNKTITENSENNDGIIVTQNNNKDYLARFTAFVNEYYYYENPSTSSIIGTWSEFTNKDTRDMIIAMSTDVSLDGNSTYSKVHSYISQLSIQTFYNSSQAKEFNAFGIETYNETPLKFKFNKPTITGNLDDSDGRSNQLRLMGASTINNSVLTYNESEDWDTYIDPKSNNGWTKSIPTDRTQRKLDQELYAHQAAYDACMSRNRDLNGDGKIQDNEIRWYLASLNEYIRIGIGSSAISSEAWLYMGDKAAMERSNYPNSYVQDGALYYTSSSDGKRVFWAVEKGSYGPEGRYYSANSVPLRCVRALPAKSEGTDISSISGIVAVSTYEKHDATSTTPIVLEFKDRLANSLYRTRIDGGFMIVHNEDSPANLFYEGIYVSKDYLPMSYRLGDIIGYEGTILNPCSNYEENGITGWRVPNLVEFSALNAAGLINSNASCCTQFSNQSVRYGFAYATSTKNIYCPGNEGDINSSYRIRCVRDVPEGYTFPTN